MCLVDRIPCRLSLWLWTQKITNFTTLYWLDKLRGIVPNRLAPDTGTSSSSNSCFMEIAARFMVSESPTFAFSQTINLWRSADVLRRTLPI